MNELYPIIDLLLKTGCFGAAAVCCWMTWRIDRKVAAFIAFQKGRDGRALVV